MARRKTQPDTNRITICVDDRTKAALRTAAGLCGQELLDFVHACLVDGVIMVAASHGTAIAISPNRIQPAPYTIDQKDKKRDKLRKGHSIKHEQTRCER